MTHALMLGFPESGVSRAFLDVTLAKDDTPYACIVQEDRLGRAQQWLEQRPERQRDQVELLTGDPAAMDFGLSGAEFRRLSTSTHLVHACAPVLQLNERIEHQEQRNVDAMRELLEFAEASPNLQRIVYWSSTLAHGHATGTVHEGRPLREPVLRHALDRSLHQAERLLVNEGPYDRSTILRIPTIVDGGSNYSDGAARSDGAAATLRRCLTELVALPQQATLPAMHRPEAFLNVVPVAYAVAAADRIVRDPRSLGRGFHLVDPRPPRIKEVMQFVETAAGRQPPSLRQRVAARLPVSRLSRKYLPTKGNDSPSRVGRPGAGGLGTRLKHKAAPNPLQVLEGLAVDAQYATENTRELLLGSGIACPPFQSYVHECVRGLQIGRNMPNGNASVRDNRLRS